MEALIKKMNINVEFTHHALERGLQIGMNQEDLAYCLREAHKASKEERKQMCLSGRIYRSGSTWFVTHKYHDRLVVLTVIDEIKTRNEGYKLKW